VHTEPEKILQCKYYLNADTAALWDTVVAPANAPFTWITWKAAIQQLYPGSSGNNLYAISDLERLVQDYGSRGIFT
jgi:hypothetical protein